MGEHNIGKKYAEDAEKALNDPLVPKALTTSLARGTGSTGHLAFLLSHGTMGVICKAAMSAADLRTLGGMCFRMAEAIDRPEPRRDQ